MATTNKYVEAYLADYTYGGNDRQTYTGEAALVLNNLDSAEVGLEEEIKRMIDNYTEHGDVEYEAIQAAFKLQEALQELLARPAELARLL